MAVEPGGTELPSTYFSTYGYQEPKLEYSVTNTSRHSARNYGVIPPVPERLAVGHKKPKQGDMHTMTPPSYSGV